MFNNLCASINCDYCIFVEAESTLYDDYNDFMASHSDLIWSDQFIIFLCINGSSIQINVEVLKNE